VHLHDSKDWFDAAETLAKMVYGSNAEKQTAFSSMIETTSNTVQATPVPPKSYALWGILCGDRAPRTESFNKAVPELRYLIEASRLVGHEEASVEAHCAQWP